MLGASFPEEVAASWALKDTFMKEVAGERDRAQDCVTDLCWGLREAPGGWSEGRMCRGGDDRVRGEAGARRRCSGFRCFLYFHGNPKPRVELRSAVLKAASGEQFGWEAGDQREAEKEVATEAEGVGRRRDFWEGW